MRFIFETGLINNPTKYFITLIFNGNWAGPGQALTEWDRCIYASGALEWTRDTYRSVQVPISLTREPFFIVWCVFPVCNNVYRSNVFHYPIRSTQIIQINCGSFCLPHLPVYPRTSDFYENLCFTQTEIVLSCNIIYSSIQYIL